MSGAHLLYLCLGVLLGLMVGILPGLGGTAGLALVLPFVFGMDPSLALAMMIGLLSVTSTADTFPSVLMGVPGTASSQATVLDGFPLSQKGEAARALAAAFTASLIGGLFGAVLLTGAVFVAVPVILAFGFGEQMMLVLLALTMVGMLTGTNMVRGLAACGLGLLLGVIGPAPATGQMRLDFGTLYLSEPLPLVIVGLGMFAMPEIIDLLRRNRAISETGVLGRGWLDGFKDALRHYWIVLRCSAIGSLIGALPGLGGTVIDWIAYGHVVQTSRDRSRFGQGDIRGVLAPESANNAKEGGALVPTLLFGIPGSGSMALLLGGFILIGIQPGLSMVTTNLDLTYTIIWSIAIANIFGATACLILAPQFARLTTVPYAILAPFMLVLIFFAAFQATRDWGDLLALFAVGVLGIYMKRFGWPRPALLIGFVLSGRVEASIYQTIQVYGLDVFKRPLVLVLIVLTVLSIAAGLRIIPKKVDPTVNAPTRKLPQMLFLAAVVAFAALVLYDAYGTRFLTRLYPMIAAGTTLFFLALLTVLMLRTKVPATLFHDTENAPDAAGRTSNLHYLAWIGGMLGLAALVGFMLAVCGFIFAFLRVKARLSVLWCLVGVLGCGAVLATLSHFLALQYPPGLLQDTFNMPWPFD